MIELFDKAFERSIGDKQNVLGNISRKDGQETIEYPVFRSIFQLIVIWKMVRLDNMPKLNNKDHWTAFRNFRRKVLFGSNDPPTDKTAVDLATIETKRMVMYVKIITSMAQKENKIFE